MAKTNQNNPDVKTDPKKSGDENKSTNPDNKDGAVSFSSAPEVKTDPKNAKKNDEKKTAQEQAIDASKPYKDKDGNFWETGLQKYYIKHKTRKQIEKGGKLVFEDTGIECAHHLNLLPAEVKKRKEKGEIF